MKKNNNLVIGFIGSLDYHKGLDFLFDCINEINKKKVNFTFLIAGNLSVKNSLLINILHKLKIKKNFNKLYFEFKKNKYKNVRFLGNISNLDKFYKKIDIICFPSRMNALGRPIIEASSFGIPSIVCIKNYFNDTIINKKTGFILKFGDQKKMLKIFNYLEKNRSKIRSLGINAKKNYLLRHDTKKNVNFLSNLYLSSN